MKIIIDTREKTPYNLPNAVSGGLKTGDYSIEGYEHLVCVERKTKADAYLSVGVNRKRFEAEWDRMSRLNFAAVIIECTLKSFMTPPKYSKMSPNSALNTLLAWSIRYGVHVYFVGSRELGEMMTYRLLEKWLREKVGEIVSG